MTSKYDSYWEKRLDEIRAVLARASARSPVVIELPGLISAGERESWYGLAEIRGHELTRASMAHAAALGKLVAASGICATWPGYVFRFTIAGAGDALTISARSTVAQVKPTEQDAHLGDDRRRTEDPVAAERFYRALDRLAEVVGGPRLLRECRGADGWPRHGVYFFFEPAEIRTNGSHRVVRVGTHALTATSHTSLWERLRQHRGHVSGSHPGGGNHRASVFRRHVGAAVIRREGLPAELLNSWLDRHGPRPGWADQEAQIEQAVSQHIGAMTFLWLSVPDRGDRGTVERNSIGLTSRLAQGLDEPSAGWLGHDAVRAEIRQSGLWNVDHVRHHPEPGFLDLFDQLIYQQQLHRVQPTGVPDSARRG